MGLSFTYFINNTESELTFSLIHTSYLQKLLLRVLLTAILEPKDLFHTQSWHVAIFLADTILSDLA